MKKKKFQKNERKFKKKKGTLVGNVVLLSCIAILVVSLLFTLCAKIVDKNDAKEELSSASDELVTLAPDEEESEALTEAPTAAPTEAPTDAPTEEVEVPATWNYLLNGSSATPVETSAEGWQYAVRDTLLEIPDGDWETGREYTISEDNIVREVLTYDFSPEGYVSSIRVEAPNAFRVAYTRYSGSTIVYKVVDYPAGIHDLVFPAAAGGSAVTVTVTYFAY